jgi:hypothetical protein
VRFNNWGEKEEYLVYIAEALQEIFEIPSVPKSGLHGQPVASI